MGCCKSGPTAGIDPSGFNRPFTIQKPQRALDGAGGFTNDVWQDIGQLWASVKQQSGNEVFRHQRLETDWTDKITTYYRPDLDPAEGNTFRLIDQKGNAYNIRRIEDVGQLQQFFIIYAQAGVVD